MDSRLPPTQILSKSSWNGKRAVFQLAKLDKEVSLYNTDEYRSLVNGTASL